MSYLSQSNYGFRSGCCTYSPSMYRSHSGFAYAGNSSYSGSMNLNYNAGSNAGSKSYSQHTSLSMSSNSSAFNPEVFLNPLRRDTIAMNDFSEIKEFVLRAFEKTTNEDFPDDINISILSEQDISQSAAVHGFAWNPSIRGFAVNKLSEREKSRIYVVNDDLDKLMLVIGHEIGHVLSKPLKNKKDEEAKAYAFSLAWMKAIRENNIAGLKNAFLTDAPASNGLHDIALDFVLDKIRQGKKAIELFLELCFGKESVCSVAVYW